MDRAYSVLAGEQPDADLAALIAQIGRFMFFAGRPDIAFERIERALEIAEALRLPETMAQALNTKGIVLIARGRTTEGAALIATALDLALEHDKPSAALRAYFNLSDTAMRLERMQEAADLVRRGLALARRAGNRYWEWSILGSAYPLFAIGEWDEALEAERGLPSHEWEQVRIAFYSLLTSTVPIRVHRGLVEEAKERSRALLEAAGSADLQEQVAVQYVEALFAFTDGRYADALAHGRATLTTGAPLGLSAEALREAVVVACEAAAALGDDAALGELLSTIDALPPGASSQFLDAHAARFRARTAADGDEADRLFRRAVASFRELESPFYLAVALLEQGERAGGADAEPLLVEAAAIFERLEATPWLERVRALDTAFAKAAS